MTNIKNWLDTTYPVKTRDNITDLHLDKDDFEGKLVLKWEDFPKLERVWYNQDLRIITNYDLKIAALLKQKEPKGFFLETENRVEVLKHTPIEERLAELYPNDGSRTTITQLDLTQKGLRGSLDLSDFDNLEELTVNMDCPWGRNDANSNFITDFNLPDTLTQLTLINNPVEIKLEELKGLTKLKKLTLKGSSKYPAQWTGSLADLEDLKDLVELDISYNPAIEEGLEKLEKVEKMKCRGTSYEKQLKSFGGDVKAWKVILFPKEVSKDKAKVAEEVKRILDKSRNYLKELNKKQLTDLEVENKIEILLNA